MAVHSNLPNGPAHIEKAPILWLRPRAFNMIEHHCMVNFKEVSAPLFDFALLMFHNARRMYDLQIGPYLYLSKVKTSGRGSEVSKEKFEIYSFSIFRFRLKIQLRVHYGMRYSYGHKNVYQFHRKQSRV